MADGQEEPVDLDLDLLLIGFALVLHEGGTLHHAVAKQTFGLVFPEYLNVRGFHHTVGHHLRGTQLIATHDQVHLVAKTGEVHGLFGSGIATAHHGHILATVEETVAGSAGRNPAPGIFGLILEAQVFGGGTGCDDHRFGLDQFGIVDPHLLDVAREVDPGGQTPADIRAEALGLFLEILHHHRTGDALGVARVVFDLGGGGQLSARLQTLVHHGTQVGACGVNGGGITGWTRSDDQALHPFGIGSHGFGIGFIFNLQ